MHQPLSETTLFQWQAALFPDAPHLRNLNTPVITGQLRGNETMHVISGRLDNPTVHFEAPPRQRLDDELQRFTRWLNLPPAEVDALLLAAIAHLWLITLHPFDDGNGRVTRAVTDRALAQVEHNSTRYAVTITHTSNVTQTNKTQ